MSDNLPPSIAGPADPGESKCRWVGSEYTLICKDCDGKNYQCPGFSDEPFDQEQGGLR